MKRINNPNLALWVTIFQKNIEKAQQTSTRDLSAITPKVVQHAQQFIDLVATENPDEKVETRGFFSDLFSDLKVSLMKKSDPLIAKTLQTILLYPDVKDMTKATIEKAISLLGYDKSGSKSDADGLFIYNCLKDYYSYQAKYKGESMYYDWKREGNGDIHFGEIGYRLPNNAKVALIGDWGSGLPDAKLLLKTILLEHKPDAVIHLGDIYYSGTKEECEKNFIQIFQECFEETGHKCRVFNLAGNHDYYAFGEGFYHILPLQNPDFKDSEQKASYFSLKTKNGKWQLLGMDTGFYDAKPFQQFDRQGPDLVESEKEWLTYHLDNHKGKTILLSHHQLFSANDTSLSEEKPYLNTHLHSFFKPYLQSQVSAWFWGHEHNLVLYQNDIHDLKKGRLIGCSAFQENKAEGEADPYHSYSPNEVPYLDPEKYRLTHKNGFYYHGYALLSFSTQQVEATYYECPTLNHTEEYEKFKVTAVYQEKL